MRILRVAQKVYPEVKGGGAYHVHAMSRDQAAEGHDVTVLTVRQDPDAKHIESRSGYTVVRYDSTATLLGNDFSGGVAQYLAAATDFDVVHAHSHLYASTNLAALQRLFSETPLAITNHGLYSQTAPRWVFDSYIRTLGRWTFNRADVVFTYTDAERRKLRNVGVTSSIEVIENGIDTARFSPSGPSDSRLDSPAVLFVGRLVNGKRPLDAVRAVAKINKKGSDATLYVAGTGPLRAEMEATAAEAGIEESVVFLGRVPYEEMPTVYRSADVLVLPSRDEGLPRTVLEAMAVGTPVVVSELDQLRPLIGAHSRTVPVGDIDELATGIDGVLATGPAVGADGQHQRLLPAGYEWSGTVEDTTRQLASLLE